MDFAARLNTSQAKMAIALLVATPAVFVVAWSHVSMLPLVIGWLYCVQRSRSIVVASLAGMLWILTLLALGLSQLAHFSRNEDSNAAFFLHAIAMVAVYGASFAIASATRRLGLMAFAMTWSAALALPAAPVLLDYSIAAPLLALIGVTATLAGSAALVVALGLAALTAMAAFSQRPVAGLCIGALCVAFVALGAAAHQGDLVTDQVWRTNAQGQLSVEAFAEQASAKLSNGEILIVPPEAALGSYHPELEDKLDAASASMAISAQVVFAPLHLVGTQVGTKNAAIALAHPQAGVVSAIGVVPGGNAVGDFQARLRRVVTNEGAIMPLFCAEEWSLAPLYRPSSELRAVVVFTNHYWDRLGWLSSLQRTGAVVWAGIFRQPIVRGVAFL